MLNPTVQLFSFIIIFLPKCIKVFYRKAYLQTLLLDFPNYEPGELEKIETIAVREISNAMEL